MSASPKDKRTKDQLLRLLDDALVQEEKLADQIDTMRAQLDELRKRAEDPRAELVEDAIPSSKVPFRLDFYRTANNGPIKGIIEHLPSRQKRTFEGVGQAMIGEFVAQFLPEEKMASAKAISEEELPEVNFPAPVLKEKTQPGQVAPPRESVQPSAPEPTIVVKKMSLPLETMEAERGNSKLLERLHGEFLTQFPDLREASN